KLLEHLQIGIGGVVRAATAQVWLGDEKAEPPAELAFQRFQLLTVGSGVEDAFAHGDVRTFLHRKTDETYSWIAFLISLAAGHRAGQALLAVKAEAGRHHHVAGLVTGQCGPEGLL